MTDDNQTLRELKRIVRPYILDAAQPREVDLDYPVDGKTHMLSEELMQAVTADRERAVREAEKRARIDEVLTMPHERRPEQHEFKDGEFTGKCDCYKSRRLKILRAELQSKEESTNK